MRNDSQTDCHEIEARVAKWFTSGTPQIAWEKKIWCNSGLFHAIEFCPNFDPENLKCNTSINNSSSNVATSANDLENIIWLKLFNFRLCLFLFFLCPDNFPIFVHLVFLEICFSTISALSSHLFMWVFFLFSLFIDGFLAISIFVYFASAAFAIFMVDFQQRIHCRTWSISRHYSCCTRTWGIQLYKL